MKIKELLQRLHTLFDQEVGFKNTPLSDRHIYNKLLTVRKQLLVEYQNKNRKIDPFSFITLDCVELVEAMPYECPCLPPYGCKILRTKYKLPKIMVINNMLAISSVTSIDGSIVFNETSWVMKKAKKGAKYTANKPDYYFRNEYLYITVLKDIELLSVTAVFEDIIEAKKFNTLCSKTSIYDKCIPAYELEFPINGDLEEPLIQLSIQELIGVFKSGNPELLRRGNQQQVQQQQQQ